MTDLQYLRFWLKLGCVFCLMWIMHVWTGCGPLPLDAPPEAVAPDVQYSALWGGAFMLMAGAIAFAVFCRDAWRNVLGRR